jgi:hypothetical protein
MTTEQLNNLFTELSFKPGEEYIFNEIKSILLTNGRIIVPNYLYMRFIV